MTASTTAIAPLADVDLVLGMLNNLKARAAQHGLGAGAIWDPPVGGVVRVAVLDEVHRGIGGVLENAGLPEWVVALERRDFAAAAHERLKHQGVRHRVLPKQIERQQRMA